MTPTELRTLRTQLGLTQRQLGQALGLHDMTIYQYEAGRRGISDATAAKIQALVAQHTTKPGEEMPSFRHNQP